MNIKLSKYLSKIIFYGSIWGIIEATLGYLLHLLPYTISGMIMFPIASVILMRAYRATGTRSSLIYIGFISAGIKAINFLMPSLTIFKTINPMIAIVFEAMIVAIACPFIVSEMKKKEYVGAMIASIGWRAMYMLYLVGFFVVSGSAGKYISSFSAGFNFLIVNGAIGGLIIIGYLFIKNKVNMGSGRKFEIKPTYAYLALALAMLIEYLI